MIGIAVFRPSWIKIKRGSAHAVLLCVSQDGLFDIVLVNNKLDHCFNELEDVLEANIQVCS